MEKVGEPEIEQLHTGNQNKRIVVSVVAISLRPTAMIDVPLVKETGM